MAHYYSKFPKRQIAWANSPVVGELDLGTLCKKYVRKLATLGKSAKTYVSRGKKRFVGTKSLKSSEPIP